MQLNPLRRLLATTTLAVASLAVLPAPASAFDGVFIFGDSLSDTGNNANEFGIVANQTISNTYIPDNPYESGRYSNGEVWTVSFAQALGLGASASRTDGNVYAAGGARTNAPGDIGSPSLRTQVSNYLTDHAGVADSGALYVVAGGGNNARDTLEAIAGGAPLLKTLLTGARAYASDVGFMVDQLQAAGAQHIVVWNTPDLALAPAVRAEAGGSFLAGIVVKSMNKALDRRLAGEDVIRFDTFALFDQVAANPAAYGLVNVTDACGGVDGCDPSTYLFWDGVHPTSAGHAIIADGMIAAVVPEPGSVWMYLAGIGVLVAWRRRS